MILCVDRLRMTLLGLSAVFPGLPTLVSNLWKSYADYQLPPNSPSWVAEYVRSRAMELYTVPILELFGGCTFTQVCLSRGSGHQPWDSRGWSLLSSGWW